MTNGWVELPPPERAMYERYAQLATLRERLAVAVFEEPITAS